MSDPQKLTVLEVLSRMQTGWDAFNAYLNTLTERQMTEPTDAAGWTAKDHVMHLAVWEDGIVGILQKQSRHERMGLDLETWNTEGFEIKNAVIQQQHRHKPLSEVLGFFRAVHGHMLEEVRSLADEDLYRPYRHFVAGSTQERPIVDYIKGDSYEHYAEHQPWIQTIVENPGSALG